MKKIVPLFFILFISMLFSSCIYIGDLPPEETYTFYFFNNTDMDIDDFWLEDRYGNRYYKINDGYACPVDSGEIQSIKQLRKKDYRVYFLKSNGKDYLSGYTTIDSDTTFKALDKNFYTGAPRTAEAIAE